MYLARAISLLDSALRAETGRVSGLKQQVVTYTSPQVYVSLQSYLDVLHTVYQSVWVEGWCLISRELVALGKTLVQGG